MSGYDLTKLTPRDEIEARRARGWTSEQIAADTGYTPGRIAEVFAAQDEANDEQDRIGVEIIPAPCGTHSAFNRHKQHDEKPCSACVAGEARYQADRVAGRRTLLPHGTHAAYTRHKKAGEQPCGACLAAERVYRAALKRQERARKAAA